LRASRLGVSKKPEDLSSIGFRLGRTIRNMPCSICMSADVSKINAEIRAGESWRSTAAKFNASRSAVQRHARGCLRLHRGSVNEESRLLLKAKHARLDGRLDVALLDARRLKQIAESKQDTKTWLAASKLISRLLDAQSKRIGKIPREVEITEHARIDISKARWLVEFPPDTPQEFVDRFKMKERADLTDDAPRIIWRVNWIGAEVKKSTANAYSELESQPLITAATPVPQEVADDEDD
jgi:hypothetical protein